MMTNELRIEAEKIGKEWGAQEVETWKDQREDYARENATGTACDGCSHDVDHADCRKTMDGKRSYCKSCASRLEMVECVSCDCWVPTAEASYDVDYDIWECAACLAKEREHQARVLRANERFGAGTCPAISWVGER